MEAKELRIGNLVNYNGKEISISTTGLNEYFHLADTHSNSNLDRRDYRPIPITVEFLNKLPEWFRVAIADGFMNYSTTGYNHYIEVKYVHHAQNLYFTLTGMELPNV